MRFESGLSLHYRESLLAGVSWWLSWADCGQQPLLVTHVLCSSGPKDGGEQQPDGPKLSTGAVILSSVRDLSGSALGRVVLLRSPDIFYIKVLNIFIYVNFFFLFQFQEEFLLQLLKEGG